MELGEAEAVFHAPQHPYTEALLSSVPQADREERPRIRLAGEIPSHADPPSGCVFHTRCPRFIGDICVNEEPPLREVEPDHQWRCHHDLEVLRELQKTAPPERSRNGGAPGADVVEGEGAPQDEAREHVGGAEHPPAGNSAQQPEDGEPTPGGRTS
jgi:oligopeptide/dipeptide ABC transporter ATP-binding protein